MLKCLLLSCLDRKHLHPQLEWIFIHFPFVETHLNDALFVNGVGFVEVVVSAVGRA